MKRALLIAITYRGTGQELRGPLEDAKRVRTLLLREGYQSENILLLSEESVTPTHYNILQACKWLYTDLAASEFTSGIDLSFQERSKRVRNVVFYYSGHGCQIGDRNGDEDDGKDECLVPLDYLQYGVITDDVLRRHLVETLPVNVSLFILLDACNSGSGCDLPWNYYRYRAPDTYTIFHDKYPDASTNVCCIAAALDAELAYEVGGFGVLTARFLSCYEKGLNGKYLIRMMQSNVKQQTFVLSTFTEKALDLPLNL